jgi:hypothetical protein
LTLAVSPDFVATSDLDLRGDGADKVVLLGGSRFWWGDHELGGRRKGGFQPLGVGGGALQSAGHAVVGGGLSELTGGNFKDGFIGAGFAALLSPVGRGINRRLKLGEPGTGSSWQYLGRTATAATIGGTVTAISGGKFGNGAATAAFLHVVNHESHALFSKDPRDLGGVTGRAENSKFSAGFDTGEDIINYLKQQTAIELLEIHSHGWDAGIIGSDPYGTNGLYVDTVTGANPGAAFVKDFSEMIKDNPKIFVKNASINIYACSCGNFAKSLSSAIGSDITITAAPLGSLVSPLPGGRGKLGSFAYDRDTGKQVNFQRYQGGQVIATPQNLYFGKR